MNLKIGEIMCIFRISDVFKIVFVKWSVVIVENVFFLVRICGSIYVNLLGRDLVDIKNLYLLKCIRLVKK